MTEQYDDIVIGQGLAGSAVAWALRWLGRRVLIVDDARPATASRVSAGLITPCTGKRLVRSQEYDDDFAAAVPFYRRVEDVVGEELLCVQDALRLFDGEQTRARFLDRSDGEAVESVQLWDGAVQEGGRNQPGLLMRSAARLNVGAYLDATRAYFQAIDCYRTGSVDLVTGVDVTEAGVTIPDLGVTAANLILCTGVNQTRWFPDVPNNPARGDILNVRIAGYVEQRVVHRSIWIAVNGDGSQDVGATYDWDHLVDEPRAEGREEVLAKLSRVVDARVDVMGHRAAVRPTMRDYYPVVGRHSEHANVLLLNGLGSKGTLRAPRLATQLAEYMMGRACLRKEVDVNRMLPAHGENVRRRPLTQLAQELTADAIRPGDTVVDATVGNGFDTCFLAQLVGPQGAVIGYDVQQCAIDATRARLTAAGLENVDLRLESHVALAALERGSLSAVMFNLGYLPRADHTVTTRAESSLVAVRAAVDAVRGGGVVSVLCYRGHDGGDEESDAVERLVCSLDEVIDVQRFESSPPKPTSPVLLFLKKRHRT